MKLYTTTGRVLVLTPAKMRGKRKLFQAKIRAKMPAETRPGRTSGTAIRRNTPSREQPSIRPASSSSNGTLSKKPIMIHVISGTVMTRCAITRPIKVSISPSARNRMNQGTRNEIPGIIRQTRMLRAKVRWPYW